MHVHYSGWLDCTNHNNTRARARAHSNRVAVQHPLLIIVPLLLVLQGLDWRCSDRVFGSYEIDFGMRNNGDKGGFEVYGNYVWHYAKIKDSTESRGGGEGQQ